MLNGVAVTPFITRYEPKRESRLNDPRRMRLDDFLQYYNNTDMYVTLMTRPFLFFSLDGGSANTISILSVR